MYAEKHYSSIHLVLSIKLGPLYTRNPGKNIFILYCLNIVYQFVARHPSPKLLEMRPIGINSICCIFNSIAVFLSLHILPYTKWAVPLLALCIITYRPVFLSLSLYRSEFTV